jgi:hydroxysqualene dehydroxylase
VVGAGIAGLSAALCLTEAGVRVALHEATDHAGGRCRSYEDRVLGCRIDNGTHVLVGANRAAFRYLDRIGARDTLLAVGEAGIPFADLHTNERWRVRLGGGTLSRLLRDPSRWIPGATRGELARTIRLWTRGRAATVSACLGEGLLMDRLWRPLTEAALNTAPVEAAAVLLRPAVLALVLGGRDAATISIARDSLAQSFVEPAVAKLREAGATVGFGARLRVIESDGRRATGLGFEGLHIDLGPAEAVVLAVPQGAAAPLLASVRPPGEQRAIVNVHFKLPMGRIGRHDPLVGVLNGTVHWICLRGDVIACTTSAADALAEEPSETIAAQAWSDVARVLDLPADPLPPHRVVKEKLATPAQTPTMAATRPGPRTALANVALAGDWTDTGLPATIDAAALSGERAARVAQLYAAVNR